MVTLNKASGVLAALLQLSKLSLLLGTFISLITMVAMGTTLTPFKVFTTIAFLVSIRVSLVKNFPSSLRFGLECLLTLQKIQQVLELEMKPYLGKSHSTVKSLRARKKLAATFGSEAVFPEEKVVKEIPERGTKAEPSIHIKNVTCFWSEHSSPVLFGIGLKVSSQSLVLVCGPNRSGKTSLLLSILNELPPASGHIRRSGTVAYVCGSDPWVFSGTVRQNIVFGKEYLHEFYDQVIKSCDLEKEINGLPNGDMTMLGLRGLVLNESQRARVNLARAVYSEAEIYLLDDPCIAITDAVTRQRLYKQCICGLLAERMRIVVNAQPPLYCEKDWEQTIVMESGRIKAEGRFTDVASAVDIEAVPLDGDGSAPEESGFRASGLVLDNGVNAIGLY